LKRLAFLLLAGWGCGSPGSDGPVEDVPEVSVHRVLRIGSIDGPDDSFAPITAMAVTPDGHRVIVLEHQTRLVKFFNSEGDLVKVAGGPGGGPGEFGNPMALGVFGDTVWVADAMSYRYSFFSPDGEFLGDFRPTILARQSPEEHPPRPGMMLDDGQLTGSIAIFSRDQAQGLIDEAPLLLMDRSGAVLDTLLWRPLSNTAWMIQPDPPDPVRGEVHTSQPFAPKWPYLVSGQEQRVFRVTEDSSGPALEATDFSGQLLFRRRLGLVGPEVSTSDIEAVLDLWYDRLSQSGFGEGVPEAELREWLRASLFVPERLPPVSEIKLSSAGDIWLGLRAADPDAPQVWRVFGMDGELKYDVSLPSGFQLKEIRARNLWGVEQDELDVSYVVRLEMTQ